MSNSFIYSTGLGNVGSYQVAGTPYLTSSNILNQEKQFSFPYITKAIVLENTGSNDIFFRFSEDVNGHFKLPSAKKVELDVKCSAIFISASAGTGIQLYASLTNIERTKLLPEATLFSTASAGGGAPFPSPAPWVDSDGDGLSDAEEDEIGSDKNDPDTDGDGLPDGVDPYIFEQDGDGDGSSDPFDSNPTNPLVGGVSEEERPTFNSFNALTRVQNASASLCSSTRGRHAIRCCPCHATAASDGQRHSPRLQVSVPPPPIVPSACGPARLPAMGCGRRSAVRRDSRPT